MVEKIRKVVLSLIISLPFAPSIWGQSPPEIAKPTIQELAAPKIFEQNLENLAAVKIYAVGDQVRVIEDLREEGKEPGGGKPSVSESGPPNIVATDTSKMALAPAYKPGDSIHVVQDLKESTSSVSEGAKLAAASFTLGTNFDGIPATGFLPPDVAGAVGPEHYVMMVNVAIAIYDKSGKLLAGPSPISSFWSGFGGPCSTLNNGDPIVRYDHIAKRWLISQFALPGGQSGYHQCIAISRTSDPVKGGWYLYDFPIKDNSGNAIFPDYPKIGVWPDGYYMGTQRGFPSGGLDVWAFERESMLAGKSAKAIHFAVAAPSLFLLPSDLDGPLPPKGTPNFFARQVDGTRFGGPNRLEVFAFHADWKSPAASTFSLLATLPTASFSSTICNGSFMEACIPQPTSPVKLEALSIWTMWRLQYRNFGGHESLVTNHTVNGGKGQAGVRWYELRKESKGAWTIFQQGTYAPDEASRWMGSVAMNKHGSMAVGYTTSSSTIFPSVRYASRLAKDPPGTLSNEVNLMAGGGAQTYGVPRWGNYTTMDVDPEDDCTFWYAGEYMPSTSPAGWKTRISSIHDPSCRETRQK